MKFNPDKHHRRSIRLKGYDYTRSGACFVTICTQNRACLFGDVGAGPRACPEINLNDAGRIALQCWNDIPHHFPNVELDAFVIMPNHVHGILVMTVDGTDMNTDTGRGTACRAPTVAERFGKPVCGSLPTIIRSFKSAITKRVNEIRHTPGKKLWQRNYYEHVIRDESELNRIQKYITDNPGQWESDRNYPPHGKGTACRAPTCHAPTVGESPQQIARNFEELGI